MGAEFFCCKKRLIDLCRTQAVQSWCVYLAYVHVCICVCVHMRGCVCVAPRGAYRRARVCIAYVHVCVCVHMRACVCVAPRGGVPSCSCVYSLRACVCMCTHARVCLCCPAGGVPSCSCCVCGVCLYMHRCVRLSLVCVICVGREGSACVHMRVRERVC